MKIIKRLVWFIIDAAAFVWAVCKVIDWRAGNQAHKIRGFLE